MVTMNHWDMPQALEDMGGWTNDAVVDAFAQYAGVLYENFGDRVKLWITHNEPAVVAHQGYETAMKAPGKVGQGYMAGHNLIRSHGQAYKLYNEQYRDSQKGVVGITLSHMQGLPADPNSVADTEAAETFNQFSLGWYANPIFGDGNYPDVMKWQIGNKSLESGLKKSRLPEFTREEKDMLKGSSDFMGFNLYTSRLVKASVNPLVPSYTDSNPGGTTDTDSDVELDIDPHWPSSGSEWLRVNPKAMRLGLNWIRAHYNNIPVYITENGYSDKTGSLDDQPRIEYFRAYIDEVLKAIDLDECDVRGYTAWSFMDNFEWMRGYSEHFGLFYVNFSDPERPRTPKASARFYASVIEQNGFHKSAESTATDPPSNPPHVVNFNHPTPPAEASSSPGLDANITFIVIAAVLMCINIFKQTLKV